MQILTKLSAEEAFPTLSDPLEGEENSPTPTQAQSLPTLTSIQENKDEGLRTLKIPITLSSSSSPPKQKPPKSLHSVRMSDDNIQKDSARKLHITSVSATPYPQKLSFFPASISQGLFVVPIPMSSTQEPWPYLRYLIRLRRICHYRPLE